MPLSTTSTLRRVVEALEYHLGSLDDRQGLAGHLNVGRELKHRLWLSDDALKIYVGGRPTHPWMSQQLAHSHAVPWGANEEP